MAKNRRGLALEIAGTLFIIFLGTALHFTFDFSGRNPLVGSLSAVNESVWEHLKLPFWPSLLWMLIELYPLREVRNIFNAKAVGIYLMIVFIPAVFYSYTAFTKRSIFQVDIATFIVAVIVGQIASYKLMSRRRPSRLTKAISILALILLAVVFIAFTFYPPHLPLFQDSNTGQYGI